MKRLIYAFVLLFAATAAFAQAPQKTWTLDDTHSKIEFTVDHMVISSVTGHFGKFSVDFASPATSDFQNATVSVSIDAASIDTQNEKRDAHLRSADFFDTEKYPQITFASKTFKKKGKNYKVVGDFTLHGVTKEVELTLTHNGTIKDPWGNTRAGFTVEGALNRKDFGLTWNQALETGGLLVGEDIQIIGNFEVTLNK